MKRLISLTSAIAVSTLNIAASVPVSAQSSIQGSPAREFERPISIDREEVPVKGFKRPNPGEVKIIRTPINRKIQRVQVDKNLIRVRKEKPIEFEAFDVKDPETGKRISPNKILTLPNGKRIKAGEYYAQLNKIERQFSQSGYSLRQPGEITIQESTLDKRELQRQQQLLQKTPEKIDLSPKIQKQLNPSVVLESINKGPKKPIDFQLPGQVPPIDRLDPTINPGTINPINPTIKPGTIEPIDPRIKQAKGNFKLAQATSRNGRFTRRWNKNVGSRGTFAAYLRGKIELEGSRTYTKAYAGGSTGGYAFNNNFELASGKATVYAPVSGRGRVNAILNVGGQRVYNFRTGFTSKISKRDSFSRSLDFEVADIKHNLGPISITARFGVRGRAGFKYKIAASGASREAYAQLCPDIDSTVYGQSDTQILFGGAGVNVNLLLLKANLKAKARANVVLLPRNRAFLRSTYSVHNDMQALKGKAYGYAYVYVPQWGIPPWKKKQWNWNIFNSTGFKQKGYLLRNSSKKYF